MMMSLFGRWCARLGGAFVVMLTLTHVAGAIQPSRLSRSNATAPAPVP